MTRPQIELDTDELRAHADLVDGYAAEIDQALAAAKHVTMQIDAYGLLCGPRIVPLLKLLELGACGAIGRTATSVGSLAELLRVVADRTDLADRAAANRMRHGGD